jgi:hypothetical protein
MYYYASYTQSHSSGVIGMGAAVKKARKTFTLSRESLAFLREVEREKHATSVSAALDELLLEKRMEREQERYQASIGAYYDNLSDDQVEENAAWGKIAESQFPLE